MCADVCVKPEHGLSGAFCSELGLKHGCPLCPPLFGLFADDLQCDLEAGAAGFALPVLWGVQVPALLYARDLALVSHGVARRRRPPGAAGPAAVARGLGAARRQSWKHSRTV